MKSHSCSWAVNHAWLFVSLSLQVCRCSLSSPKGNRRGVLAAIARLKTATCSRPWTNTGMRTVSNAPAVTAVWGRWAPPFTQKPTSSSVAETTWGKKDTHVTALPTNTKVTSFPQLRDVRGSKIFKYCIFRNGKNKKKTEFTLLMKHGLVEGLKDDII